MMWLKVKLAGRVPEMESAGSLARGGWGSGAVRTFRAQFELEER